MSQFLRLGEQYLMGRNFIYLKLNITTPLNNYPGGRGGDCSWG